MSDREHWQIYVVMHNPHSLSGIKKLFGKHVHCEVRKGTHEQAVAYCSKEKTRGKGPDDGPFTWGAHDEQGKRNDLKSAIELIKNSDKPMDELIEQHPEMFVKFQRGLSALIAHRTKPRTTKTEFYFYFGPPGAGKTYTAFNAHNIEDIYFKDSTIWWDGYTGQKIVIIDDYCPQHAMNINELLRLTDRYPHRVQFKGGSIPFTSERIYITSNWDFDVLFEGKQKDALRRRIDSEVFFPGGESAAPRPCGAQRSSPPSPK